jgi:hypothetical protein
MVVVTYTPPNSKSSVIRGIMLQMQGGMIEVAFDMTETKPFSIGWMNPRQQIGKVTMKSGSVVNWRHPAMRLISAGKLTEARAVFSKEEAARKEERIRKERAV